MGFGNLSILSIVSKQRYSNRTENRRVEKIADFIEPGSIPLLTMIVTDIVLSLLLNYNLIIAGQTKQTGGVIQSSVQDFNDVIESISA